MAQIAAKPALYAGVWFRSRLEASWAAFMDHHAIEWAYETDYFEFGDGSRYLPDFWLPESRAWIEVKGVLCEADEAKITRLAARAQFKDELVILIGAPAGLVFGEVMPDGKKLPIDLLRCRKCDRWTFTSASCRFCGAWDGGKAFDDEHKHLGGPCRSRVPVRSDERASCRGTFGYDARGLREMDSISLLTAARDHAARLGIGRR